MISWWKRLASITARRHNKIVAEYREIATTISDGLGMMGLGDAWIPIRGKQMSIHNPELYHILDEVEEAYASFGYRIIPLENWIDYAGWGVSLDHLWLVKREEGERPQFTKFELREELLKKSKLMDMVIRTGKPHEAYLDEDNEMQYRIVED